ncbi:YciI family protein [Rhodanobacter aciditrophus]|uniref:YciI family protein n=1 Tax=Rhodanobacter aciditrophus TaxID=1623218 RepID=UPI003CF3925F
MQFMMFVVHDPGAEPYVPEQDNIAEWVAGTTASGTRITGDRLRPPAYATTVRVRGGKVLASDGPFAEAKEWIAGFDLLDCASLDEAVAIAARHPMARFGSIELRPFWPLDVEEDPRRRNERESGA